MSDKICSVEGCNSLVGRHGARGMCPKHYRKHKKATALICAVNECTESAYVRGLCYRHYYRLKTYGDASYAMRMRSGEAKMYYREYYTFGHMKRRCLSKKDPDYANYGGRGIKICDRWLGPDGFHHFLEDMGAKPQGRYSLDRIDVDGPYSPENCRWANDWTQAGNKRGRELSMRGVYKDSRGRYTANICYRGERKTKRFKDIKDAISQRRAWEECFGIEID